MIEYKNRATGVNDVSVGSSLNIRIHDQMTNINFASKRCMLVLQRLDVVLLLDLVNRAVGILVLLQLDHRRRLIHVHGTGDEENISKALAAGHFADNGVVFAGEVERQRDGTAQRVFIVVLQDGNLVVCMVDAFGNRVGIIEENPCARVRRLRADATTMAAITSLPTPRPLPTTWTPGWCTKPSRRPGGSIPDLPQRR